MPCIGGASYRVSTPYGLLILWYDSAMRYLSYIYAKDQTITAPSNAAYFHLRSNNNGDMTTYNHNICINLSDPAVNDKYFPYIKRQEDLGIIRKYFPEGMKSAGTAHDEIRYNKASGKWEKVVRIGEVDMGTLSWYKDKGLGDLASTTVWKSTMPPIHPNKNGLCAAYPSSASWVAELNTISFARASDISYVGVTDPSYEDSMSFKTAMAGVILYYELAEPIVTELDEADQFKDLDYKVWNGGTEKANAEGKSAPLAADITYGFNAIGKIKELESLVAALRAKVGI